MSGVVLRGTVLHCSRFGAVVRLEDSRLALLPSDRPGYALVRQAATAGRHPDFPFIVEIDGRRCRISVAHAQHAVEDAPRTRAAASSASLEEKIIDYLRQTAEWDDRIGTSETPRGDEPPRANRLLPFEFRARRQYRDSPERPKRRRP